MTAREITTDSELRAIAGAGTGFVITPFNRRWHAATCSHVQAMTVGTRKWFAANTAELVEYVQERMIQSDSAKPIESCPACEPG